jgi:hypothetical protein
MKKHSLLFLLLFSYVIRPMDYLETIKTKAPWFIVSVWVGAGITYYYEKKEREKDFQEIEKAFSNYQRAVENYDGAREKSDQRFEKILVQSLKKLDKDYWTHFEDFSAGFNQQINEMKNNYNILYNAQEKLEKTVADLQAQIKGHGTHCDQSNLMKEAEKTTKSLRVKLEELNALLQTQDSEKTSLSYIQTCLDAMQKQIDELKKAADTNTQKIQKFENKFKVLEDLTQENKEKIENLSQTLYSPLLWGILLSHKDSTVLEATCNVAVQGLRNSLQKQVKKLNDPSLVGQPVDINRSVGQSLLEWLNKNNELKLRKRKKK